MAPEMRGIRIPLKESSWQLIVEALEYLVECPDIAGLEERRAELAGVLQYIKAKLGDSTMG